MKITKIADVLNQGLKGNTDRAAHDAVWHVATLLAEEFTKESGGKFDQVAFLTAVGKDVAKVQDNLAQNDPEKPRPVIRPKQAGKLRGSDSSDPRDGEDYWGYKYRGGWSVALNYALALSAKFPEYKFEVEQGRKFDKITQVHKKNGNGTVHAFIDKKEQTLLKAASRSAPQKEESDPSGYATRYRLHNEYLFRNAIGAADAYGAYLYKKTRTRKVSR